MFAHITRQLKEWWTLAFHRKEKRVVRATLCKKRHIKKQTSYFKNATLMRQTDIEDVAKLFGEARAEEFSSRLESGYGFNVKKGNELVGYIFASAGSRHQEGSWPFVYDVPAREGVIYLFDFWVSPKVDIPETSLELLEYAMSVCCRMGFERVFLMLDPKQDHLASVTEKLGFSDVGALNFQSLLGVSRTDLSVLNRI